MLVEQVYVFLGSIITGTILGILFDFFRSLRWNGIRDIWVYIQDIIFWIVVALIIIVSTFIINEGELRGYMLIGYLLGAGFYMLLFSRFILGGLKFIFGSVRKGIKYCIGRLKKAIGVLKPEKKVEVKQEI